MTLRKHTMRDILSKLDKILLESAENTDANTQGKRKALQDIEKIPAAKDPEIKRAIDAKKAELGQEDPQANKAATEDVTKKLSGATPAPAPNPYLKDILMQHIDEVRHFVQTGYFDPTKPLFQELYEYFANEIPESVRRNPARLVRRIGDMIAPYAKFYANQKLMNGQGTAEGFQIGDEFGISFSEDFEIGSTIVGIVEDGIVIELDDRAFEFLTNEGWTFEDGELTEGVAGPKSCWKGYRKVGTKPGTGKNAGKRVNDCEKISESTGIKWDWKGNDPEQIEIKIDGMPYLLKNTENGVVIHGADIPGTWGSGEDEGSLDFEANLKGDIHWATFDSGSNYGPGEPDDYVVADHLGYVLDEIKKQYGETWEQIKDEAEGGLSIEKEDLDEASKAVNFDADDIARLQGIDDLDTMKNQAFSLISNPSKRPMKPEKVEWFKKALDTMQNKNSVIKLMYDLLLSGEGRGVLGSRSSMRSNTYRQRFNDDTSVSEAEYQGRKVSLGKPMAGDVKKSKVYVKNPQGNVVKVNFGDKKMRIKKSNPGRRKSFRARHNCSNPGPRHKARYWSCRAW